MATPTEPTLREKLDASRAERERLARLEATTGSSGAIPFTPKQALLAPAPEESKNVDLKYRWVNINNHERATERQAQGYVRVPLGDGGRQVGNLARFAVPRQQYDQRVAALEEINRKRLSAHKTEVEEVAEKVARELRDRHGLNVRAEDIHIKEG